MDPWEIITVVLSVIGGIALLYIAYLKVDLSSMPKSTDTNPIASLFFALTNYIPFGLMIFGFVADMFSQQLMYSITTIMSLILIVLNGWVGSTFATSASVPSGFTGGGIWEDLREKGWCTLPGFEAWESKYTPMSIIVSSAIAIYYIFFAWANRPSGENVSIIAGLLSTLALQVIVFGFSGCSSYYIPIGGSIMWNILLSLLVGFTAGATSMLVVQYRYPQYAPFVQAPIPMAKHLLGPGGKRWTIPTNEDVGSTGPVTGGACAAIQGGEDDAMVCEAYRNGQLVTDSLT